MNSGLHLVLLRDFPASNHLVAGVLRRVRRARQRYRPQLRARLSIVACPSALRLLAQLRAAHQALALLERGALLASTKYKQPPFGEPRPCKLGVRATLSQTPRA